MKINAIASMVFLLAALLTAQTVSPSIVTLKNGSVIKGTVLEMIPEKSLKIRTYDGSIFVFSMAEVLSVANSSENDGTSPVPDQSVRFSVSMGAAIPLGDFGSENNGAAKTGFTVGAQITAPGRVGFLMTVAYSDNAMATPSISGISYTAGHWSSLHILGGLHFGSMHSAGTGFYIAPLAGVLFGATPELNFPFGITVPSAKSTAFAYGAELEIFLSNHVSFGTLFVASKPTYNFSSSSGNVTFSGSGSQSTSLLLVRLCFTP